MWQLLSGLLQRDLGGPVRARIHIWASIRTDIFYPLHQKFKDLPPKKDNI